MLTPSQILAIRVATDADAADVARLAKLDSRHAPTGKLLLGVVDGEPRAAYSVDTGAYVADPFVPTADVVAILKMRAERLTETAARAPRVRSLLPRIRRLTSTA